jgi:hypothetical protein
MTALPNPVFGEVQLRKQIMIVNSFPCCIPPVIHTADIYYISQAFRGFKIVGYLQLIAGEPQLQISTIKTKYLAPSYFADITNFQKRSNMLRCWRYVRI